MQFARAGGSLGQCSGPAGAGRVPGGAWLETESSGPSASRPKAPGCSPQMADDLRQRAHTSAALVFKFDEPLSHLIYAGSDFLVACPT